MTGRDLILYILENNLENEEVYKDGRLLGYMTIEEAAVKFNVGIETIKIWTAIFSDFEFVNIGNAIFIPITAKSPLKLGD